MVFSVVFASHHPCSCRASLPLPKFSAPCFSPLDFSSLWLTLNLQLSSFNRIFFCPSSPHLCALCVLCGENSLLFRSSLIPRHSPLTYNSFRIRTYEKFSCKSFRIRTYKKVGGRLPSIRRILTPRR